jgi:hypothetical protein
MGVTQHALFGPVTLLTTGYERPLDIGRPAADGPLVLAGSS